MGEGAQNKGGTTAAAVTVKVAIIGGGCAGLAAAWQLCDANDARAADGAKAEGKDAAPRYEVTVYERQWCLGGKGASVRDANGRILEHGLHVWLGFYENAFRLMRDCYRMVEAERWGPRSADESQLTHGSFDEAFVPEPHIGVANRRLNQEWQVWSAFLPPMKGQPGEPLDELTNPFTLWGYVARGLALAKSLLQSVLAPAGQTGHKRSTLDEAVELDFDFDPTSSPGALVERMSRMLRLGLLGSAAGLLQGATMLERWLQDHSPAPRQGSMVLRFVEALATNTRRQLADLVLVDEELRRKTEIIDLLMTIAVGLYKDRVLFSPNGLDAIDGNDYREWLRKHGATNAAVDSPLVTGIYDLVFAYRDGRHDQPALSAAQALRGAMRMFMTYRGSMFWRMNSGMGDAVFAPLYLALRKRGVIFKFAHSLERAELGGTEQPDDCVTALYFAVAGTPDERATFVLHKGCWPQRPTVAAGDWSPELTLRAGQDFDAVIFAHGIEPFAQAFKHVQWADTYPTFAAMFDNVKTVGTQAAQVWLDRSADDLGWHRGAVIVAGLGSEPARRSRAKKPRHRGFETWADMTHTLAAERAYRGGSDRVGSIAYFCGTAMEHKTPALALQSAHDDLGKLLDQGMAPLWPQAFAGVRTPRDGLVSADGQSFGTRHAGDQYVRVNVEGSERYTQSLPGSSGYRISPLNPWFANATIAGDWTQCGFNGGCVEAAVMSGLLAAHAISGTPELNCIVGYHHP